MVAGIRVFYGGMADGGSSALNPRKTYLASCFRHFPAILGNKTYSMPGKSRSVVEIVEGQRLSPPAYSSRNRNTTHTGGSTLDTVTTRVRDVYPGGPFNFWIWESGVLRATWDM